MSARQLRALIFDFDGLIVDTETAVYESWRAIYHRNGHDLPLEIYLGCVGSTIQQFNPASHLNQLSGLDLECAALQDEHRREVRRRLSDAETLPGVRELLGEAREAGLKLAVASSSPFVWVNGWLQRLGLAESFDALRTLDMVKRAKPDPELFLTGARELGVSPEEAIVLEDSHHGLTAAKSAGIPCVVVPNEITRHSCFEGAAMILASMTETNLEDLRGCAARYFAPSAGSR